ncbi:hypothetical protein PAAG_08187 [Paracoccidioides lutzii Pb01]|uniref:Low temperature requirement A n=1 Tax=Paracoccidioides lutzii (strain ATCC MYA-826 / Pb01) TaxID=502779 RepID=C1HBP6_PARBA|nr:hypothetical protein PAAG_08187 [Paracoccidioides lutzii Pb01]EEH38460.2 hypothetical protein PAAG_08187 [Paracoccidioides lutzii Pb01]
MRFKNIINRDDLETERRQPVPWIANPTAPPSYRQNGQIIPEDKLETGPDATIADSKAKRACTEIKLPLFKKRNAAPIELFYDLFFVANLSSYTSTHEINTSSNLTAYVGYISLLWFVWLQNTFFDLRFYTDSVLSRLFTTLHLGVMAGFAILGPNFDPSTHSTSGREFRNMSLVLMTSRLILTFQYVSIIWYIKGYKRTVFPTLLVIGTHFLTAMAYLGLAFTFTRTRRHSAFLAWYVIGAVEAMFMISISSFWRLLSFKGTAIVERFNGMTLIVLGEGVVGMAKAATRIAQGAADVTKTSIGLIICYILIIYFMYTIYFDQISEDRFGSIRQQIWAFLHFPLHMGILLTIEGSRGWILWSVSNQLINLATARADAVFQQTASSRGTTPGEDLVDSLKLIVTFVSNRLRSPQQAPNFKPIYDRLLSINVDDPNREKDLSDLYREFFSKLYLWVLRTFGIDLPALNGSGREVLSQQNKQVSVKFHVLFAYFFIAAGVTLIFLASLHWFGKAHKTRGEVLSIIMTTLFGTGLALISLFIKVEERAGPGGSTPYTDFFESGWIVPTVVFTYGLVIATDCFIVWVSHRRWRRRVT